MVPDYMLPHEVTKVRPVASTVDPAYGTVWDWGPAATRTVARAWLEQTSARESHQENRSFYEQRWALVINDQDLAADDRIEWAGHPAGAVVFRIEGTPEPAYTPRGPHHLEAQLRIVEG